MVEDLPVTAACGQCGETLYLTGNIWPHANGLLLCAPDNNQEGSSN